MSQAASRAGGQPAQVRKARANVYTVMAAISLLSLGTAIGFVLYRSNQLFGSMGELFNLPKPGQRTSVPAARPSRPAPAAPAAPAEPSREGTTPASSALPAEAPAAAPAGGAATPAATDDGAE